MTETNKWKQLQAPFPPEAIYQKPQGGVFLDYVGHADVTERLNNVDPTWTFDFVAVADDGGPLIRTTPDGKTNELWITLTVLGVTRPAVGTCPATAYSGQTAKELISDALRNGAMRFGVALDLWKKHDTEAPAESGDAPRSTSPTPKAANRPDSGELLTKAQSGKLWGEWHHRLNMDKVEYLDAILEATGRVVDDDRTLTKQEASKVIEHLVGLVPGPVADGPNEPPLEEPQGYGYDEEPF